LEVRVHVPQGVHHMGQSLPSEGQQPSKGAPTCKWGLASGLALKHLLHKKTQTDKGDLTATEGRTMQRSWWTGAASRWCEVPEQLWSKFVVEPRAAKPPEPEHQSLALAHATISSWGDHEAGAKRSVSKASHHVQIEGVNINAEVQGTVQALRWVVNGSAQDWTEGIDRIGAGMQALTDFLLLG
jgi:hypothetical protein